MPLQIIGAGFGRTGTMSLMTALNELGFPCYHMIEVIGNKDNRSHLDFWRKVANAPAGAQQDWEQVFAHYKAAVDNPACCVWRELAQAYPDAKIILTLHPRGADAWYDSTIDTIYSSNKMWQFKLLEIFTPFGRKFGDMSSKLIWGRSHRNTMEDRQAAIQRYEEHAKEVQAELPPERLLVFSVDQGWEPLCRFLGLPVPATPFPDVNDRASIKKSFAMVRRAVNGVLIGFGLLVAAALYWLLQV